MKEFEISEIEPNSFFSKEVYLDDGFVLTAPEMRFDKELIHILNRWKYTTVLSDGKPNKEYTREVSIDDSLTNIAMQTDSEKLEKAENFYNEFVHYVEKLFIKAVVSGEFDHNVISGKIMEILEYVEKHPHIQRYVAIDDMDLSKGLEGHFVKTSNLIKEAECKKAIGILNGTEIASDSSELSHDTDDDAEDWDE